MSSPIETLADDAIGLLEDLIGIPSFSEEESAVADRIQSFLSDRNISVNRHYNNLWAFSENFSPEKPTILLNSHHDTVRPNEGWEHDPFTPVRENDRLYGLGSNDAGGPLVSLIAVFLSLQGEQLLPYNLVLALTAEEEISGEHGISSVVSEFGKIDLAIVGEPSGMRMGIAERGALVLECRAAGRSGHAARNEGENAIEKALDDIQWVRSYQFPESSGVLGDVKMTVTMISAGTQHNVIPDSCKFTLDVRVPDTYRNDEVLEIIRKHLHSEVIPVTTELTASRLPDGHPLFQAADNAGITTFVSPTSSDQGLLDIPSVKIGPGESERSHTADEYIKMSEIRDGIGTYLNLLRELRPVADKLAKVHWR